MRCKGNAFFGTGKLFRCFFSKKLLIHPVFVVCVAKFTKNFQFTILMEHADGGMTHTVEHVRLDGSIMDHVLKNNFLAYLQFMIEAPISHIVATQTTVAPKTVTLNFEL